MVFQISYQPTKQYNKCPTGTHLILPTVPTIDHNREYQIQTTNTQSPLIKAHKLLHTLINLCLKGSKTLETLATSRPSFKYSFRSSPKTFWPWLRSPSKRSPPFFSDSEIPKIRVTTGGLKMLWKKESRWLEVGSNRMHTNWWFIWSRSCGRRAHSL